MVDKSKFSSTDLRCVWNMGGPCGDEVYEVPLFDNQIKVPVCSNHIEDHEHVMILHANDYDVEEVISKDSDWRKQEVLTLRLSGLDKGNVKL